MVDSGINFLTVSSWHLKHRYLNARKEADPKNASSLPFLPSYFDYLTFITYNFISPSVLLDSVETLGSLYTDLSGLTGVSYLSSINEKKIAHQSYESYIQKEKALALTGTLRIE